MWLAALGLVLALAGLLVATDEFIGHAGRVSPLTGTVEPDKPVHGAPSADRYHPPGSSVWMTP